MKYLVQKLKKYAVYTGDGAGLRGRMPGQKGGNQSERQNNVAKERKYQR